ncbi:MAG: efflux RND transporter periplasmic adaptor subunit [Gammaproteobacteria bacterium]
MIKRFFLTISLCLLIFGGLFGWKFYKINQAMNNVPLPPPPVVAAAEVKTETWQPYLTTVGSLVAVAGIDVSNEIAGKVTAIHFESGQPVQKGQLLVEMDVSTDLAELKALLAQEELAKVQFARSEKLIGRNFIAKADYDQNKALLAEAHAQSDAKRAVIAKKRIHAPFSGKLGIRRVDVGQYLAEGTAIVPLQKLDTMYADFTLPESRLSELFIGQAVEVKVQAYPERIFRGAISAVNPLVDAGSRSVKVRATLDNPQHALHPGMFADIKITSRKKREVLTLPDTAISYNPYGDFVFAIEPDKQGWVVKVKQVSTGESRNGRVEISKGLTAGEKAVSAGQVKLRNGMPVALDDRPAPGERE